MLFSKRSHEGYLMIDDRCSGGGMLESATITCSHCHAVVVLNPDRTRARGYCPRCDHYVCDRCSTQECRPLNKFFDAMQERAFKEIQRHG